MLLENLTTLFWLTHWSAELSRPRLLKINHNHSQVTIKCFAFTNCYPCKFYLGVVLLILVCDKFSKLPKTMCFRHRGVEHVILTILGKSVDGMRMKICLSRKLYDPVTPTRRRKESMMTAEQVKSNVGDRYWYKQYNYYNRHIH